MPEPVPLAHEAHGPLPGPAVALLHGFPFDRSMWSETAAELARAGYRAILPDLRGHGKSPGGDGPATMDAMADDVVALLDGLGVRSFVVVGFSMGGYVALQLALRHRSRLRAIALVDTRAEADSPEAAAGRAKTIEAVRTRGMEALVESMVPKLLHPATLERDPGVRARLERMMRANPPAGAVAALEGMRARPDVRGRLAGIGLPCLVAVGEEDQVTPPDAGSRLAQAFRGSDFELIPKAGHIAPLENPRAFHKVLLDWLARVAPA